MSKLKKQNKFIDLSDYGRPIAKFIAASLKNTNVTPIHVTLMFGLSGAFAIVCILKEYFIAAAFFLILKSILDAADGELSRVKNTPSYVGRYLDSIFDIILNAIILLAIMHIAKANIWLTIGAFICIQFQGTLYNYYYVILRNKLAGSDTTSKVFENKVPIAFEGETQKAVTIAYHIFNTLYIIFDKGIYYLDKNAIASNKIIPSWFMCLVSIYGLGFQLLIIAILLPLGFIKIVIPFFIFYTCLIPIFVGIRKIFL